MLTEEAYENRKWKSWKQLRTLLANRPAYDEWERPFTSIDYTPGLRERDLQDVIRRVAKHIEVVRAALGNSNLATRSSPELTRLVEELHDLRLQALSFSEEISGEMNAFAREVGELLEDFGRDPKKKTTFNAAFLLTLFFRGHFLQVIEFEHLRSEGLFIAPDYDVFQHLRFKDGDSYSAIDLEPERGERWSKTTDGRWELEEVPRFEELVQGKRLRPEECRKSSLSEKQLRFFEECMPEVFAKFIDD